MRQSGAGQRWDWADEGLLRRHDVVPFPSETVSLVQTFEPPGGRPVSVNLSFLSSRPKLANVLSTTFRMTYQPRPRRKTVLAVAWVLKIFCLFLNDRAKTMPDVLQARDLSADLMKRSLPVWLVARRRLQRKTAATVYGTCACFLRRAKRVFAEEADPFFRTPRHLFDGADGDRAESKALSGSRLSEDPGCGGTGCLANSANL